MKVTKAYFLRKSKWGKWGIFWSKINIFSRYFKIQPSDFSKTAVDDRYF